MRSSQTVRPAGRPAARAIAGDSAPNVDVAVVGAGAVGIAAAIALARQGLEVALIGPADARRDGRTVALMQGSWSLLDSLGVTEALRDIAAPLAVMRLVDDTGSLFRQPPVEFRASELGLDAFGWNVENAALVAALSEAAQHEPGLRRIVAGVMGVGRDADGSMRIEGADGPLCRAALVVGADGRGSRVRAAAGIAAREWRYPQVALTTMLAHTRDHRDTSTEFHTRQGPCTLVPMPGLRSSLVWLTGEAEGQALAALPDAEFARAVEKRTHGILGRLSVDGPRGLVPMGGLSVAELHAPGVALIGEAAHVFPPIGAQGLNLGMRDVADLAAAIDSHGAGEGPGSDAVLADYGRRRRSDVRMRTRAVDALNRTLLADMLPADFLRGAGLLALGAIGPLRRAVMREGLAPSGR